MSDETEADVARERFAEPIWSLQQLMSWVAYRDASRILEVVPMTLRPRSAWYDGEVVHPLLTAMKEIGIALQLGRIRCLNMASTDWFDPANDLWRLHSEGAERFFAREEALRRWPKFASSAMHTEGTSNNPTSIEGDQIDEQIHRRDLPDEDIIDKAILTLISQGCRPGRGGSVKYREFAFRVARCIGGIDPSHPAAVKSDARLTAVWKPADRGGASAESLRRRIRTLKQRLPGMVVNSLP